MSTVIFTWELGAGLGHLVEMVHLVRPLIEQGHQVYAALRDLSQAERVLGGLGVRYLQAPVRWDRPAPAPAPAPDPGERPTPSAAYSHLLQSVGFIEDELAALAGAWRAMMEQVRPQLVVFNHSPTALLASAGLPVKRVVVGNGFCSPPDRRPLGVLLPGAMTSEAIVADEERVLSRVNAVLRDWGLAGFDHLGRLYGQADETILLTIPELDPFGPRPAATYSGIWTAMGGAAPRWPAPAAASAPSRKLFGYLRPTPSLPRLLELIEASKLSALLFVPGLTQETRSRFERGTICFSSEPVDLDAACEDCDLAVTSGTGTTVARLLLAGKPALHLPQVLERELASRRAEQLGAALVADPDKPDEVARQWRRLLDDESLAAAARRAAKMAARPLDPAASVTEAVGRIARLLASPSPDSTWHGGGR